MPLVSLRLGADHAGHNAEVIPERKPHHAETVASSDDRRPADVYVLTSRSSNSDQCEVILGVHRHNRRRIRPRVSRSSANPNRATLIILTIAQHNMSIS